MHVFVSHSSEDNHFAVRIATDLRARGIEAWIDEMIPAGAGWDRAVEQALRAAHTVLVVASTTAFASPHVMDEIDLARKKNKRIIPVLVADVEFPLQLTRQQYVNFLTQRYEDAFAQLMLQLNPNTSHTDVIRAMTATPKPTKNGAGTWVLIFLAFGVLATLGSAFLLWAWQVDKSKSVPPATPGTLLPDVPAELRGHWVTECLNLPDGQSLGNVVMFEASEIAFESTRFAGPNCVAPLYKMGVLTDIRQIRARGEGFYDIDTRVLHAGVESFTADGGTEPVSVELAESVFGKMPTPGFVGYELWLAKESSIYRARTPNGMVVANPLLRPTSISGGIEYRRK